MTFFNRDATRRLAEPRAAGPATGLVENVKAAFQSAEATELLVSEGVMVNEAMAERRAKVEEITGQPYDEAIAPYMPEGVTSAEGRIGRLRAEPPSDAEALDALRTTLPPDKAGQILTDAQIPVRAQEIALERVAANEDVAARANYSGLAGQFVGAAGAQFTDPLVLATLPFGPATGARLAVAVGINGALAAGVTAAQQPAVQAWRERLGLPSGFEEAAKNVGFATAGGAGITTLIGLVAKGIGAGVNAMRPREAVEAFDDFVKNPTPEQIVARDTLDAEARFEESNPITPADDTVQALAASEAEHTSRAARVAEAMDNDEPFPRFPEDGPEPTPLIDRTTDYEPFADPVAPAVRAEIDTLTQAYRTQIEEAGDFMVVLDEAQGPVPASRMLEDFDNDDAFLREIETCR